MTEPAGLERELHDRLEFEELIAGLSAALVNVRASEVDRTIEEALSQIGTFMAADRAFVMQFSDDRTTFRTTHKWLADGLKRHQKEFKAVVPKDFSWLLNRVIKGGPLVVSDVTALPGEAGAIRRYCETSGINPNAGGKKFHVNLPHACGQLRTVCHHACTTT